MALTFFVAAATATLGAVGAFDGNDGPKGNAARDQYGPPTTGSTGKVTGTVGVTVGGGAGGGGGVGAGVGTGVGAGSGAAAVDAAICPASLRITSGSLMSGSAASLCTRDSERLIIRSGSPTDYVATYKNVPDSSSLSVDFTGSSLKRSCDVAVSMFDYDAKKGKGDWVEVMSSKLDRTPKSIKKDSPDADTRKYVDENGESKARVRCVGGEFIDRTDQLVLRPG